MAGDVAAKLLRAIISQARVQALLSDDHFSVDGTLIEAWASVKSFKLRDEGGPEDDDDGGSVSSHGEQAAAPTGRSADRDFRGEKRSNATHASTTDPDARLFKKARGQAAKLCHMGHVLMEYRNGLVVDAIPVQLRSPGDSPAGRTGASNCRVFHCARICCGPAIACNWQSDARVVDAVPGPSHAPSGQGSVDRQRAISHL